MGINKEYSILITVLKNEKKYLSILDVYNQVSNLPSKYDHHHRAIPMPLSDLNKENIQPNKFSTAIVVKTRQTSSSYHTTWD